MKKPRTNGINALIMKSLGLFGGTQALSIVCSVVRAKLVTLWIGPLGLGLFGLWNTALELLNTVTNLGINSSSVRNLSQASADGNAVGVARIVAVVRRWSLWLAIGGAALTVILAPLLSSVSFQDLAHCWGFVALAAAVAMTTLANGEKAVLQGTGALSRLAKASICATIFGLAVSVPMFYFWGEDSVLPSIIAYAAMSLLVMRFARSRSIVPVAVSRKEAFAQGREFVSLGIFMTVGSLFALISSYLFNAYLHHVSGTEEVGYYQAGYTLVNKYAGLVLSAIAVEYFPRLSRVVGSAKRTRIFVSQEINISLWLLAPIVVAMILLRRPIVSLLYSAEFCDHILPFVSWMLVGTLLRAFSWAMSYEILARGDGKTFICTELTSEIIGFGLNVWFYSLWGLTGLGLSFACWYAIYSAMVWAVYHFRYHLRLSRACYINLLLTLAVTIATALALNK